MRQPFETSKQSIESDRLRAERPGGCRATPWDSIGFAPPSCPSPPSVPSSSPAAGPAAETAPQAELSLAVIEPQSLPSGSEFGWSLSPNDADVGLVPLGDLLCQCGIRWVKFPFAIKETAFRRLRTVRKKARESAKK